MFLRKVVFLLVSYFLLGNSVFSQKIFRDGYIMKKNGDVLNGLIEYKSKQDVPANCIYKRFDIALEISYKPDEIREFGYVNGNRYESKTFEGKDSFMEVLVSGNITLYRKGSKYYLEKGMSGVVALNDGSIEYKGDGDNHKFDGLTSFLKYITEGKSVAIKEKISLKEDLVPIIAEFNKESGSPYIVYNQEFSEKTLLNESFRTGGSRQSFGIYAGLNIYSLIVIPEKEFYIPSPDPEIAPTIGLTYEKVISRMNDRLNLRIDLMFLKQNFYSFSEYTISPMTYRDDAFFDFTGLKLPVLLQYSFTSGRMTPYINAGVSYMKIIQKNYVHIRETETFSHDIFTYEDRDMTFYPGEVSAIFGAGLKIRLNSNIKLNIQGRIEIGQGLLNTETPLNKYKQLSLQPTFVIGITL